MSGSSIAIDEQRVLMVWMCGGRGEARAGVEDRDARAMLPMQTRKENGTGVTACGVRQGWISLYGTCVDREEMQPL